MQDRIPEDTPVNRADITKIEITALDNMLEKLREKRLANVKLLEAIAQTKADEHGLATYMKMTKALERANKKVAKIDELLETLSTEVNKLRIMQIEIEV